MVRRSVLQIAFLAGFLTFVCIAATPMSTKPNFIFVLADDWGWGDVGFNDPSQPMHTPNLDKMARQGVIFTDFHTASPVCSPSRAGFMTGRDPARVRIHTALNVHWTANTKSDQANFLDPKVPTITRLLQGAGWRVGHFGKWHLGSGFNPKNESDSAPLPTDYGIDDSCTFNSNDPCQADAHTGNTSVDIVGRAMEFMRSSKVASVPFYVNIWLHVSHDRLDPTQAQKDALKQGRCKARNFATNQTVCPQEVFIAAQQDADVQVGRLNTLLGELNLHESTLIFFATDNGPEEQRVYFNAQGSAGPFRGRKRSLYEGGTRVPSFAVWGGGTPKPTIPAGAVDHTPLSGTDWFATVAAIAGVPVSSDIASHFDGEDMSEVFLDRRSGQRNPSQRLKALFWEWRFGVSGPCANVAPHLAVRDGDWKYLVNVDGTRPELYKLDLYNTSKHAHDFNERANLVAIYPTKAAQLASALKAWHATLPACASWVNNPGCDGFTSPVFGSGAQLQDNPVEAEDSEPDWWLDATTGQAVSYV